MASSGTLPGPAQFCALAVKETNKSRNVKMRIGSFWMLKYTKKAGIPLVPGVLY